VSIGIIVKATKRAEINANVMQSASCLKNIEAKPLTSKRGKNTATVVSVEAVIAAPTSDAPVLAASAAAILFSRCLKIASNTTIAESTTIPIATVKPPRVRILRLILKRYMAKREKNTVIGITIAT